MSWLRKQAENRRINGTEDKQALCSWCGGAGTMAIPAHQAGCYVALLPKREQREWLLDVQALSRGVA
jgi:hypothetical protein